MQTESHKNVLNSFKAHGPQYRRNLQFFAIFSLKEVHYKVFEVKYLNRNLMCVHVNTFFNL